MTDDDLTQAELFDVFSNARRRRAVRCLKARNGACDLSTLVEQVAAWENDTDPDDVTRAQRRRVYISLYQTHLPMLEDHGIVDWDPDAHTIELLPSTRVFDPYLDRDPANTRSWDAVYASLSIVGTLALGLAGLSVGLIGSGIAPLVAITLSVAVFAVAVVHHRSRRSDLRSPLPGPWR